MEREEPGRGKERFMADKYTVLKKYFGYDSFREGQELLIDSILRGQDVLGIMPTGAGKSVCYQVPALMLPGITVVVKETVPFLCATASRRRWKAGAKERNAGRSLRSFRPNGPPLV